MARSIVKANRELLNYPDQFVAWLNRLVDNVASINRSINPRGEPGPPGPPGAANVSIIEYNLTPQVNGVTQAFNISASITINDHLELYYAGQRLFQGVNYTVNLSTHVLTTTLTNPPTTTNNRTLVLKVIKGLS